MLSGHGILGLWGACTVCCLALCAESALGKEQYFTMAEKVKIILDKNADILRLPAIALRGLVVFPGNVIHFEVGRKKSIAAIEWAISNSNAVFLTAQQDIDTEDPSFKDLSHYLSLIHI